jgi:hypothetical protein
MVLAVMPNVGAEVASAAVSRGCVRPPADLVAWWRAQNNARDATGEHNGSLVGDASFARGRVGRAFDLDGNGDSISIPDDEDWAFGLDDFSIDAWIYIYPSPSGDMTIVGQTTDPSNWWRFGITSTGRLRFQAALGGGAPLISVTSVMDTFAVESWHHIAVTRSSVTDWAFYHNGEPLPPDDPSNVGVVVLDGPVPDLSGTLSIGRSVIGLYFKGRLDEIEIFHRALTHGEIRGLFDAGPAGKCLGKVKHQPDDCWAEELPPRTKPFLRDILREVPEALREASLACLRGSD